MFYPLIIHAPKKEYDKRLQYVLDGQMNKDLIILGSSRGVNNIVAKQLEDSTGLSTYNLSYRGSDISFQYFVLQSLLKYNKPPKTILLVLDYRSEFKDVPTLNFRYDRLFPLKNNNYINNFLISKNKQNELSRYFCLSRVKQKDFNWSEEEVLPINILTSHGSKINALKGNDTLEFQVLDSEYEIEGENLDKIKTFKLIQDLCKKNDISLIYVFPPNFNSFDFSFYYRVLKLEQFHESNIIYNHEDLRYKDSNFFRDVSHLNKLGAELFTSELSTFINELE